MEMDGGKVKKILGIIVIVLVPLFFIVNYNNNKYLCKGDEYCTIDSSSNSDHIYLDPNTKYKNLTIYNENISNIKDIENIKYGEELNYLTIEDCDLKSMQGIEEFSDIQELNLSGNEITKIENLENLENLESAYYIMLFDNPIDTIENLETNPCEDTIKYFLPDSIKYITEESYDYLKDNQDSVTIYFIEPGGSPKKDITDKTIDDLEII